MNMNIDTNIDTKKWLMDNFNFYEEIYEHREGYCLEFCLKNETKEFIDLCYEYNIPFTFYPEYKIAIAIHHVKLLIEKIYWNNIDTPVKKPSVASLLL